MVAASLRPPPSIPFPKIHYGRRKLEAVFKMLAHILYRESEATTRNYFLGLVYYLVNMTAYQPLVPLATAVASLGYPGCFAEVG